MSGARPLDAAPLDPKDLAWGNRCRIIEMPWADDSPFEAIRFQFGFDASAVIRFTKQSLKTGPFRLWRRRVEGRVARHQRRLAAR